MGALQPNMPVEAYKTYRILSPVSTHYRPGTCAEADCPHYLNGWQSRIDESTELGQRQAYYIRRESGRRFAEHRDESGLTVFAFEVGQTCFGGQHQVRLDRPELYVVQDGDWRGNPTGRVQKHANAQDWVDDVGEHQQRLADRLARG